jgi:hypothetical protein
MLAVISLTLGVEDPFKYDGELQIYGPNPVRSLTVQLLGIENDLVYVATQPNPSDTEISPVLEAFTKARRELANACVVALSKPMKIDEATPTPTSPSNSEFRGSETRIHHYFPSPTPPSLHSGSP